MREAVKNTKLTENCSKETIREYVDKELIPQLTVKEKIGIMSGQITEEKLLYDLFEIVHYNFDPYPTLAVDRLGIPNVRFVDGPRGVVAGSATCFPVSMARGATFDRELEEEIGRCIGAEIRAVGGNYYGGVCINLPRNPRWGRAQETYGEDSYHIGEMGASLTKGIQSQNVMACIKHFALNSIENARFTADVQIDKRTLHEVYLPHFKKCIEAAPLPSCARITACSAASARRTSTCFTTRCATAGASRALPSRISCGRCMRAAPLSPSRPA